MFPFRNVSCLVKLYECIWRQQYDWHYLDKRLQSMIVSPSTNHLSIKDKDNFIHFVCLPRKPWIWEKTDSQSNIPNKSQYQRNVNQKKWMKKSKLYPQRSGHPLIRFLGRRGANQAIFVYLQTRWNNLMYTSFEQITDWGLLLLYIHGITLYSLKVSDCLPPKIWKSSLHYISVIATDRESTVCLAVIPFWVL